MEELVASNAWAEIIGKAAVSPLGITALVVLVAGTVVVTLIKRTDKPHVRLGAIGILFTFCGVLASVSLYTAEPTALPPVAAQEAKTEGPSQQPPLPSSGSKGVESPQPTPTTPAAPPPLAKAPPPLAKAPARVDCGTAWTGWIDAGRAVGNPCPKGCPRGAELGQSFRAVGFPPRPQIKHKFQCWHE